MHRIMSPIHIIITHVLPCAVRVSGYLPIPLSVSVPSVVATAWTKWLQSLVCSSAHLEWRWTPTLVSLRPNLFQQTVWDCCNRKGIVCESVPEWVLVISRRNEWLISSFTHNHARTTKPYTHTYTHNSKCTPMAVLPSADNRWVANTVWQSAVNKSPAFYLSPWKKVH